MFLPFMHKCLAVVLECGLQGGDMLCVYMSSYLFVHTGGACYVDTHLYVYYFACVCVFIVRVCSVSD